MPWDRSPLLRGEPNPLLLLSPGIGQGLGKTGDREIRGCRAIHNCCDDAGRQEGEGSEQADVPFALGPKLCDLGEGGDAAEPDVIDPSPSFGNCGKQSITAFGPHRRFSRGRMNDALHRREVWRGPCEPDRGHLRTAGSLLIDDGVFGLIRRLARRNEADFQCLGFDNHALDMAFDQVAIRKGGRRLYFPRSAFPLVPALGSTTSAAGDPALFGGFTATTAESDFSRSCTGGYGFSPSRRGPSAQ